MAEHWHGPGRTKIIGIAVLAFTSLVVSPGTGQAEVIDNIYPTATTGYADCQVGGPGGAMPCLTDNSDVYYYMDSSGTYELETPDRDTVSSTLKSQYSPTDLAIHYDSSPVFEGSGETDIIYQEGSTGLPSSADGVTWCNGTAGGYECDQAYIRIRGNGFYTPGIVCHETGHAVGLLHGADASPVLSQTDSRLGCMETPVYPYDTLGSQNIGQINLTY